MYSIQYAQLFFFFLNKFPIYIFQAFKPYLHPISIWHSLKSRNPSPNYIPFLSGTVAIPVQGLHLAYPDPEEGESQNDPDQFCAGDWPTTLLIN